MPQDVSDLMLALSSSDPEQVAAACESLAMMADPPVAAAVPLVRVAGHGNESAIEWAGSALESMGPPDRADLDALLDYCKSPDLDATSAYWALTLAGRLGEDGQPGAATIANCLEESYEASVRERAAWALERIGDRSAPVIDALERAAANDSPRLSRLALHALGVLRGQ